MIEPLQLAQKPTPIQCLDIPSIIPDVKIHIKRDDLTGLLSSGNKIRKLEYLLADAKNKKCDCIITAGPIQSNHIRTTMYVCATMGIKAVAVLAGKPPKTLEGNLLLDSLFGGELYFLDKEEYDKMKDGFIQELTIKFRKQGYKPYLIPTGGSNGIGALGYLAAMEEMAHYIKTSAVDAIFCAVGSGGTYAGLLMGKYLFGVEAPLYGILVDETIEYFQAKIKNIINESSTILEKKLAIDDNEIKLINGYIGEGYGIPYPEEIEVIKKLALKGIVLDPVYTGKAFYGMVKERARLDYHNPIFIHTGGIFSLFAYKESFC
uniref:D-cysteine desulfhydrase family protein n=1 Tax=candidate division WOR-3 bacterium TaxID=2052148 RepID=A0A7C6AAZ4_UNCW3